MKQQILAELAVCGQTEDVRILFSIEAGSRSWGLASETCDYDVRFVYVRPKSDYLRLENVRDTIECKLDRELDIVGWDVRKFLCFMRSSNPTVYEWLDSTIVYCEDERFRAVRDVAPQCFNSVAHAYHYLEMATKNVRYLQTEKATLKRYLYAVRALLACRWSTQRQEPIPMDFDALKDALLDAELVPLVNRIAKEKRRGLGKDRCEPIPELDAWILDQEKHLRSSIATLQAPTKVPWQMLDDVFLHLVG